MIKRNDKAWIDLAKEVDRRGGDGEKFVKEMQDLYAIFTPGFASWLGSLYNPEIGGFHSSTSGRNTEWILPDIESTFQAVDTISKIGFIDKATDLPEEMKQKIISYVCSLQSPDDGYIYHPQWDYSDPEWKHRNSRIGRDMMWAVSLEEELNFKLPYPTANDRLEKLAEGDSDGSEMPEQFRSKEAFIKYMDSLDWDGDAYFAGNMMAAQSAQVKAAGLAKCAAEYLNAIQDPKTGLWGRHGSYMGINALLKITAFYTAIGEPILNAEAAADSAIECICADMDEKAATVCWQYNIWFALEYLIKNIRRYDSDATADRIIKRLLDTAPECIRRTKEKLEIFKLPDGSFIYMKGISSTRSQGAIVANPTPGVLEGSVNASVICIHRTVEALFATYGIEMPPIYDKDDYKLFLFSAGQI